MKNKKNTRYKVLVLYLSSREERGERREERGGEEERRRGD
jgi:hypothetical protein